MCVRLKRKRKRKTNNLPSSKRRVFVVSFCRYETFGQEREGHVDRKRATVGRVLFGPRTIVVTKQHQQVQSYGSGGTKTAIATGVSERESPWWRVAKVHICIYIHKRAESQFKSNLVQINLSLA